MFDKYDQVKLLHWKLKVIFMVFILGGIVGALAYLSYSQLLEPAIAYCSGAVLFRIAPGYFASLGNSLSVAVDYYVRIQEAQGGFDWGSLWVAIAAGALAPTLAVTAVLGGVFRRREGEE
jgi:hypothetical protein